MDDLCGCPHKSSTHRTGPAGVTFAERAMRIHLRPLRRENVHRAGLGRGVAGWARTPISWSCLGAVLAASLAWAPPAGAGGAERTTPSSPSNPPSAAHGRFAGRIEIRRGPRLYL